MRSRQSGVPMMRVFILLFSLLLFITGASAADIGFSVRALGMGNAHTAIVQEGDSVFYNPAGYGKGRGITWTILDPVFGLNNVESYQEFVDLFSDSNDVAAIVNGLYGRELSLFLGAKSILTMGGFAAGAYGVADISLVANNPVYPNLDTRYILDQGYVAGWGFEAVDNLHVGFQARRVTRTGGQIPVGVSTIANLDPDAITAELSRKGLGYAFDVGLTYTLAGELNPTFSYTVRDMGNTSFRAADGGLAPLPVRQEQILGVALAFKSALMDVRPALDFRYLDRSDIQLGKKINLGVELSFPMLDVRGGFHQGYYTLGAGFDFWLMRIDLATYGQELGVYPGQLEDRRYMMQITFEFGIDASNFSFLKMERPSVRQHGRKLRR